MIEILLEQMQENLVLVLPGIFVIAAFVRHMLTKDRGTSRPDDDYEDEREDWWMNPGNDMGFFERHDD